MQLGQTQSLSHQSPRTVETERWLPEIANLSRPIDMHTLIGNSLDIDLLTFWPFQGQCTPSDWQALNVYLVWCW